MIKAYHSRASYYLKLKNLNSYNNNIIAIKFDTGAVNTIISLEALCGSKACNKQKIIQYVQGCGNLHTKNFKSASGNNMTGVLCHAKNVKLSGCNIEDFYYYLIINVNESIALLGDDFISYCNFTHQVGKDIDIVGFDRENYRNKEDLKCIDTSTICEISNMCVFRLNGTACTL